MLTVEPTDYAAICDYLFGLKNRGVKFGIDRMILLAEALGHPERRFPVIHIAGTNGKGSVAAMLESIFRAAGRRTGLYTSPHLVRLGERIQVNRELLEEEQIVAYTRGLRREAERLAMIDPDNHPSFFEFMTGMAFLQFAERQVDIGIIEVGMGGRLDATNVVVPEVSVITSIGLDHCEALGDTHARIAYEKAGIIKEGRPVIIGKLPPEAERVIREVAAGRNAPVISVADSFGPGLQPLPQTNLPGEHQRWNAATALLACRSFPGGLEIPSPLITEALCRVEWPGRWQRVRLGGKQVILDASHNPEGAEVLARQLADLVEETGRRPVVITGILGSARAAALLSAVANYAREIHLVVPNQPRASSFEELESILAPLFSGPVHRGTLADLFPDPNTCTAGTAEDVVVVTGSIYLLGELLARIEPDRGAGEGRLQDW